MNSKKLLCLIVMTLFSSGATAISVYEGKITALMSGPNYNSYLYIQVDKVSGTLTNAVPNCENPNWDYIVDTSTENGKFYASLLLSAYIAGKTVNLQGYDDCAGNVERLRHIWLK